MSGATREIISKLFPNLYHMAQAGSWQSIQQHGLLSTRALLDLFEVTGQKREQIESKHRAESVLISHHLHGSAMVRDQKPMSDQGLNRALLDGLTPRDWYESLNSRVFFWLTEDRLKRLMNAKAYRGTRHTVLTIETKILLERHANQISLSPINSGCTKPFPHPRGNSTFLPLLQYPLDEWMKRRPARDSVVELAVDYSVEDVRDMVITVNESGGGLADTTIWSRRGGRL